MIETVGSVISSAQAVRNIAVEANASNAAASNFELGDQVAHAPVAPFVSPYVALDTNYDTAVLQIRDSETGDVLKQFPSERVLEQRQALSERQQAVQETVESSRSQSSSASSESNNVQVPSNTQFQATALSQQGGQAGVVNSAGAAEAQAAISALSAGAQSGQAPTSSVDVTA